MLKLIPVALGLVAANPFAQAVFAIVCQLDNSLILIINSLF